MHIRKLPASLDPSVHHTVAEIRRAEVREEAWAACKAAALWAAIFVFCVGLITVFGKP